MCQKLWFVSIIDAESNICGASKQRFWWKGLANCGHKRSRDCRRERRWVWLSLKRGFHDLGYLLRPLMRRRFLSFKASKFCYVFWVALSKANEEQSLLFNNLKFVAAAMTRCTPSKPVFAWCLDGLGYPFDVNGYLIDSLRKDSFTLQPSTDGNNSTNMIELIIIPL